MKIDEAQAILDSIGLGHPNLRGAVRQYVKIIQEAVDTLDAHDSQE